MSSPAAALVQPAATEQPTAARNRLVLVGYTAAIFVSAPLLFAVQPMFTKMVLPRLGGSPAVWSVAMVFFQTAVARRLRLRASPDALKLRAMSGRRCISALMCVAVRPCRSRSPAGWGEPPTLELRVLAAGAVRRLDRPAVLCAVGQRAAVAGLVRAHRTSRRAPTRTSSTPRATSAASSRCCPIRLCSSRSSRWRTQNLTVDRASAS